MLDVNYGGAHGHGREYVVASKAVGCRDVDECATSALPAERGLVTAAAGDHKAAAWWTHALRARVKDTFAAGASQLRDQRRRA